MRVRARVLLPALIAVLTLVGVERLARLLARLQLALAALRAVARPTRHSLLPASEAAAGAAATAANCNGIDNCTVAGASAVGTHDVRGDAGGAACSIQVLDHPAGSSRPKPAQFNSTHWPASLPHAPSIAPAQRANLRHQLLCCNVLFR